MRCSICNKDIKRSDNYLRHIRLHDDNIQKHRCSECSYSSVRKSDLKRHLRICHGDKQGFRSATSCIPTPRLPSEHNSDHTANPNGPTKSTQPTQPEAAMDTTPTSPEDALIASIIQENRNKVRTYKQLTNRAQDRYNFEINSGNLTELAGFVTSIWKEQKHPFKLNLCFGFILQNLLTDELVYYYASRNNRLLPDPIFIQEQNDVESFIDKLGSFDLLEYCRQQRPNTKFVVRRITNAYFYVDKIRKFRIGCLTIDLPNYIKRRQSVVTFLRDQRGQAYEDNLCFFRCLAYHRNQTHVGLTNRAQNLLEDYKGHRYRRLSDFAGVDLAELPSLEDHFNVNIQVYQLNREENTDDMDDPEEIIEDQQPRIVEFATQIFVSRMKYNGSPLRLNLYQSHFSLIKNFNAYVRRWACSKCNRLFDRHFNLMVHQRNCSEKTRLIFPGGGYGIKKNVFDLLQENGVPVPNHLRLFPYRLAYDFETICLPTNHERGRKEKLTAVLEPVSVSVCSNVPGYTTPLCFVSEGDPKELITRMYSYITEISARSYELMTESFADILGDLSYYTQEYDSIRSTLNLDTDNDDGNGDETQMPTTANDHQSTAGLDETNQENLLNRLSRLQIFKDLANKLERWLSRLVCLGFNTGRFDINLIRKYLFPFFLENDVELDNVIKRNNDYLSITTSHAVFLDIKNYLAAGISYDKWLKSYDIKQTKGFFPYEWLTCLQKLESTELPDISAFWSSLKQASITQQQYAYLQEIWNAHGFRTMKDLLVWYNNLDVVPFLTAAEKLHSYWNNLGIDAFKGTSISLPGLALSYLSQKMSPNTILPIFDEQNKELYFLLRRNIVGGLSIVMHRYHERSETRLPNGTPVMRILSFDCNSLYLWALGQPTGTGLIYVWRTYDQQLASQEWKLRPIGNDNERQRWEEIYHTNMACRFHRERGFSASKFELEWLEWTAFSLTVKIDHKFNGRQKYIIFSSKIRYPVDGYVSSTQTVLQFHGCYWHGHGCSIDQNSATEEQRLRRDRTSLISARIRSLGYTVIEKWECDWRRERNNDQIKSFLAENLETSTSGSNCLSGSDIISKIRSGELFGLVECDIEVPWFDIDSIKHYEEFPPICKNAEISLSDIGDHMREYAERGSFMKKPRTNLINSYWGRKIVLSTPMIRWLLNNRLQITRIYTVIEMKPKSCFSDIVNTVANNRRAADANPAHKAAGESWKTLGNSLYGKAMTNKERHKRTLIVKDECVSNYINDRRFHQMDEVGESAYEVSMDKKTMKMDLPLTIAVFVYNYAKLRMLEFVYDFLKKYLRSGSFQLVCSDTDSIIAAYESENLDDLVKDELREEYFTVGKKSFLSYDDYSNRTPGLFKVELSATGIVALCAKTYFAWNDDDGSNKCSSKGISKRTNQYTKETFLNILRSRINGSGKNFGFRLIGGNLYQYEQQRDGLAYLYVKRRVSNDGISTSALHL